MAHSPQTHDAACTMYQQGATVAEVARFYSLPPACVSEWLRKADIPRRPKGRRKRSVIPYDIQAVFTLVDASVARDQACEMVGVSKQTALAYWNTFRPMTRLKPGRPRKTTTITTLPTSINTEPAIGRGRRLSFNERVQISLLHYQGVSARTIAAMMHRSPSTISRELARNTTDDGAYVAKIAQQATEARRARPKVRKTRCQPRTATRSHQAVYPQAQHQGATALATDCRQASEKPLPGR